MPFISNFVIDFNNPIIFSSSTDSADLAILTTALDSMSFSYELQSPFPNSLDFSSLDNMLAGRDVIIVGGPLTNAVAAGFQNNLQSTLSGIGVTNLSFSLGSLDGTQVATNAPTLSVTNGIGTFVLSRDRNDVNGTISDWAFIVRVDGTTNSLLYIAGIRDQGTAAALFVLDWATKLNAESIWPYSDASQLTRWKSSLSTGNSFLIQFKTPSSEALDLNNSVLDDFIGSLNENSLDDSN